MAITNFPKEGDNKAVSLRSSDYARFSLDYALSLKEKHPKIWRLGGNIKGNAQFEILSRIQRQGGVPKTRAEEKAVRLREAWAARHYQDHRPPGVVAQIKWLVVGRLGEKKMMALIDAEKEKGRGQGPDTEGRVASSNPAGDDGHAAPDGVLLRTAVVRTVRREARLDPSTGKNRQLVVVDFVASTEDIDSHDSILVCDWDQDGRLKRYLDNPVLLWMHGREGIARPAIGKCENVRCERKQLLATAVFDDTTEFDREIAEKYAKGVLNAFSVGFAPGKVELRTIDGREILVFSENELRENSAVNVGSNAAALAQRAFVTAARDMARALGGRVQVRDVLAQLRAGDSTPRPPPLGVTPAPAPSGDPPMTTKKTIDIEERDVRADKGGATAPMKCPGCGETFDLCWKSLPMPADKAAELDQARGSLAEQTALIAAEQKRAVGLETRLAETSTRLATMLLDSAIRDIDARVGKKSEPTARDEEIDLARTFLADTTPDPESLNADKVPTRTLGQKKFAARLAKIDGRRDLGLLGPAITTTTPMVEPTPQIRAITEPGATATPVANGGFTRGGDAAASLLDDAPAAA